MKEGFRWCPHCGKPHDLADRVCRMTGLYLDMSLHHLSGAAFLLPGTILDGKYRVLEPIGSGGMGTVFEAIRLSLDRRVAVKVVSRARKSGDATERLLREARILTRLQHPNICDVYDVGALVDGSPYVVLERLYGCTLASRLARQGRLGIDEAMDLFSQVLSGLHVAHAQRILHRDLKPQNIFMAPRPGCSPLAKIVDFGLALDLADVRITVPGRTCGTPHYMSPEQLRDETLDERSDIFSASVALYEALAGTHPFVGRNAAETRSRVLRGDAVPLRRRRRDVSPALEYVVMCGLAKERSRRPMSALAFQEALRAAVSPQIPVVFDPEENTNTITRPQWRPSEASSSA